MVDFLQNILVQDPTLLEIAWVELLEKNMLVTAEELAEVLYFHGELWTCLLTHLVILAYCADDFW